MSMLSNTPLLPVRQALDDLSAARESARVQLKLLAMETRDRKDHLQTTFESFENDIERGLQSALATAAVRARELTQGVQQFLAQHARARADFKAPVRAIMTVGVRTCEPEDSLSYAAQLMWDHDCGALPVSTPEGRLVGIITDRDICMAGYLQGCTLAASKVRSAMSTHVLSCELEDSIERVLDLMRARQLRRLPVVHPDGHLAGIVSLADIARFARSLSKDDVAPYASLGFALAAISENRKGVPDTSSASG